jgi:putative ATPase
VKRAWHEALADVERHGSLPVPKHLRSAGWRERRDFGHGAGYVNPHDFEGHDVGQQYLPDKLAGRRYYRPTDEGAEKALGERMKAREERRRHRR